jgi:hypothetical protein
MKNIGFTIGKKQSNTSDNNCVILTDVRYQVEIYNFILINDIFNLKLHIFEFRTELLLRICLFTF